LSDFLSKNIFEEKYRTTLSQRILSVFIINLLKLVKGLNKDICELTDSELIKIIEKHEKINPKD
jgi:hypothetical protein